MTAGDGAESPDEIRMVGIRAHPLSVDDLHERIAAAIAGDQKVVIGNHNLHSVYLAHRNPAMAAFGRQADWLFFDGMGLVALARWLGHHVERRHRVTYVDWIEDLAATAAERAWRLLHLGGQPGVGDRAAHVLVTRHPGLSLSSLHGYFDVRRESAQNRAVLDAIRAAAPHVLLVGMGMPRQECWVLENLEEVSANVILTSGACMDYVAGTIATPPRWAGSLGLEWLFRLVAEPRRLGRRYVLEPWYVASLAMRERWRPRFELVAPREGDRHGPP